MLSISELAQATFFEFLITLPFHLFAYVPFWEYKRLSQKRMVLLLTGTHAAYTTLFALLLHIGFPITYVRIAALPIYGIPFFLSVSIEWGKILFLYVFTMDYMMMVRGASAFLEQLLSGSCTTYSWQSLIFCLALTFVSLPFMLKYFCQTARNVFEIHAPNLWSRVWMLPLFTSALVLLYTFPHLGNNMDFLFIFSRLALMICMFLIYSYIIQTVNQFRRQLETEEKLRRLEQLTRIQADQYGLLLSRIEETRRARHDLRQHLRTIQGCIASRDFDSLDDYVKNLDKNTSSFPSHTWSGNPAVDAVLGFYTQKAIDAGIDTEILFHIETETLIPEPELCVLLGNLLENALEACSLDLGENPKIRVCARQTGKSILSIAVDNTCSAPPTDNNGMLLSSKHPGPGIGTESVRITAERYNGDARFEWKDGVFYASVMLNP